MKKIITRISALTLAVCMMFGSVSVFAGGQSFSFKFTDYNQKKEADVYAKEDNEQNSYVTPSNLKSGYILGCRVIRKSDKVAINDYTLCKSNRKYVLPILNTTKKGKKCYLRGQLDDSGKKGSVTVKGTWLP